MISPADNNPEQNSVNRSEILEIASTLLEPERLEDLYLDLFGMSVMEGGWPELPTLNHEMRAPFSLLMSPTAIGKVTLNVCGASLAMTNGGEVSWTSSADSNGKVASVTAQADFSGHNHPALLVTERSRKGHGDGEVLSLRNSKAYKWLSFMLHDLAFLEIAAWRWNHRHFIDDFAYNKDTGAWSLVGQAVIGSRG